ncbi:hypothetical protein N7539_002380 [Penicillium diatomitis]|uniref:Uncharacterized protein n=1 Tax=Penicillium diatomitis TaxID=2819901 RepID=A0A9X0BZ15_9EURO|nr:uncharacterized protein N7539_002380 [Penicillium diatomitis]KAJ5490813.1 hypothetical protein N7539_002380 [Penicillium diatomitis]
MGTRKKKTPKARQSPDPYPGQELTQQEFLEQIRMNRAQREGREYYPLPKKHKGPTRPTIPAFDPALPPAAFPSMSARNEPIPTGSREGHLCRIMEDSERRLRGLRPLPRESYHPGPLSMMPGQVNDALFEEPARTSSMDNSAFDARNRAVGDLSAGLGANETSSSQVQNDNPDAGSNTADHKSHEFPQVKDVDSPEVEISSFAEHRNSRPKWGDLVRPIRMEILDNILSKESWENTVRKLGLSRKQAKRAAAHLDQFYEVMQVETQHVEQELKRQLHFMITHSLPITKQVYKLSALNTWDDDVLDMQEKELFICSMGNLRAAWRFLEARGLPRDLAGRWSNGVEVIDTPGGGTRPKKRVRWSYPLASEEVDRDDETASSTSSASSNMPPIDESEPVINVRTQSQTSSQAQQKGRSMARWQAHISESNDSQSQMPCSARMGKALGENGTSKSCLGQCVSGQGSSTPSQNDASELRVQNAFVVVSGQGPPHSRFFTARDITEGIWQSQLEKRYQELADASAKACTALLVGSEENDERDTSGNDGEEEGDENLDQLLADIHQFDDQLQEILDAQPNVESGDVAEPDHEV